MHDKFDKMENLQNKLTIHMSLFINLYLMFFEKRLKIFSKINQLIKGMDRMKTIIILKIKNWLDERHLCICATIIKINLMMFRVSFTNFIAVVVFSNVVLYILL